MGPAARSSALGRPGLVCPGLPCQLILEYESRVAAPTPLSVFTLPYLAVRAAVLALLLEPGEASPVIGRYGRCE